MMDEGERNASLWQRSKAQVAPAVRHALSWIRFALSFVLQVFLALILLFEEWGWRPLSSALAWLGQFKLWARVERGIAALPPYGALAAFTLPSALLFPLKVLALYFIANGKVIAAGLLFVGAKIASTALVARIFMLTRPALMQLEWFAAIYNVVIPWKEALFARIRASWAWRYGRMVKTAIRLEAKQVWQRFEPSIRAQIARLRATVLRAFKGNE